LAGLPGHIACLAGTVAAGLRLSARGGDAGGGASPDLTRPKSFVYHSAAEALLPLI